MKNQGPIDFRSVPSHPCYVKGAPMTNLEVLQAVKAGKLSLEDAAKLMEAKPAAPAVYSATIGPSGMAFCRVGKQSATFDKAGAAALIAQINLAVKNWDSLPLSKTAQLAKDDPATYKANKAKQLTRAAQKAAA